MHTNFPKNSTYATIPGKLSEGFFACMVVLQSMWKATNHCWNFMESGPERATFRKCGREYNGGKGKVENKAKIYMYIYILNLLLFNKSFP